MVKPFIIGTRNSGQFLHAGAEILRNGGTALDAVEAATRLVELNPNDTSVGLGGIPNILGVQEMDASLMCGKTMNTGSVGALKGFKHPISVARKVLDEAPHVLLVGAGAEHFARVMDCETGDLETEESVKVYKAFVNDAFEHEGIDESQAWAVNYARSQNLRDWYDRLADERHGTVNIVAIDENGDIASAVSTSGTALKFPGRLGDSPIIGAGNYCDNRYGAATCTGRGELAIRNSTARTIIHYMEEGLSAKDAASRAMKDIHALKAFGSMNCIVFDAKGNTTSATTRPDRESVHWYMDMESKEPEKRVGINVNPPVNHDE
ncbi:MAG: isoaspartyl peptidase/L-asparaginase [Candidatus Bathyarchaeota archaeon]|nr:isoaspartyl peptidase/L-asparaginase [Candidatus Bathyarchaeota archaeon]